MFDKSSRYREVEDRTYVTADGREVVYVERLDSPDSLRFFTTFGRRNDAHCTSTGKILLAFSPPQRLDELLGGWKLRRRTEHTITDIDELREELRTVRQRGYAVNQEESGLGLVSVAAPVRDHRQQAVAALSVVGPSDHLNERLDAITQAVVYIAGLASHRLGSPDAVENTDV